MKDLYKKPAIIIAGTLSGLNEHFSRYLSSLNSIYGLDQIDVYVHTWDIEFNRPYIDKLVRLHDTGRINLKLDITSYEDSLFPDLENALHSNVVLDDQWKPYVLGYSLWRCVNQIRPFKNRFTKYIKYKPDCNVNNSDIIYSEGVDLEERFNLVKNLAEPYLVDTFYDDCVYGEVSYKGLIEHNLLMYEKTIDKVFLNYYDVKDFLRMIHNVLISTTVDCKNVLPLHHVQGPVMWRRIFESHNIPVIPVYNFYNGGPLGEIIPRRWNVHKKDSIFQIKDRSDIKYVYKHNTNPLKI